ncbi:uncharacterized protein ARMOST_11101 [Armillaria ostoyae]|uniref:Uncharacterized protein n=1 Tax=Armillaria ostoyae TaxID=47428 RepID=A0A284RG66_ARMOS|nr:uncharacterized protein ARMOST_11101 [Armillaria ostoyae]
MTANAKSLNAKASAVGAAAVDAVKKSIPSSSSEARGTSSASTSSKPSSSFTKAFSKTDRSSLSEPSIILVTSPPSPTPVHDIDNKPEPAIRSTSFVPPPVFATA